MGLELTDAEVARLQNAVNEIETVIGYAQGRAASYAARRDELTLYIQPPTKKKLSRR